MGKKIPVSVLVVIHTPELRILQLERAKAPGFWQSVTGSIEPGETLPDTACREVGEETGIRISATDLIDWRMQNRFEIYQRWRHRFEDGTTHNLEHLFSLCVPEGTPIRISPNEHTAWRWLDWRAAVGACFSWSNRDAIYLLAHEVSSGRLLPTAASAARHSGQ